MAGCRCLVQEGSEIVNVISGNEMHPDLSQVVRLGGDWQARLSSDPAAFHSQCVHAIEQGKVLCFPDTGFDLTPSERSLLRPGLADPARRNISLSADGTTLSGVLRRSVAFRR
jgi:hypothetical protein